MKSEERHRRLWVERQDERGAGKTPRARNRRRDPAGRKILITRRPEGTHLGGYWEFPGGKLEGSETLEACLVREIREELGIVIRPDTHLLTVEHEYPAKRVTLHFYACTPLEETSPRGLEGQEIRWVRPGELPSFHFPPPDHQMIQDLQPQNGHVRLVEIGVQFSGIRYRVSGIRYQVSGVGCQVSGVGVGCRVSGIGYRVSGVRFQGSGGQEAGFRCPGARSEKRMG